MKSLRELFRIGNDHSSSHTMGPKKVAEIFSEKNKSASKFEVTLYGSIATTGKSHLKYTSILDILTPIAQTIIKWLSKTYLSYHPNAMKFETFDTNNNLVDSWTVYSVGGGALIDGEKIIGISESQKSVP